MCLCTNEPLRSTYNVLTVLKKSFQPELDSDLMTKYRLFNFNPLFKNWLSFPHYLKERKFHGLLSRMKNIFLSYICEGSGK